MASIKGPWRPLFLFFLFFEFFLIFSFFHFLKKTVPFMFFIFSFSQFFIFLFSEKKDFLFLLFLCVCREWGGSSSPVKTEALQIVLWWLLNGYKIPTE